MERFRREIQLARKVTHRTIDEVTRLVEARRLNVAVARLMELATAARRTIDSGPGAADLGRCEYALNMVDECKLTGADFFVPLSVGSTKAVERKGDVLKRS